jgi:hypothetical protein
MNNYSKLNKDNKSAFVLITFALIDSILICKFEDFSWKFIVSKYEISILLIILCAQSI